MKKILILAVIILLSVTAFMILSHSGRTTMSSCFTQISGQNSSGTIMQKDLEASSESVVSGDQITIASGNSYTVGIREDSPSEQDELEDGREQKVSSGLGNPYSDPGWKPVAMKALGGHGHIHRQDSKAASGSHRPVNSTSAVKETPVAVPADKFSESEDEPPMPEEGLLPVGTYGNLKRLLEENSSADLSLSLPFLPPTVVRTGDLGNVAVASTMGAERGNGDTSGYSETNVQVAGVDEADIVKTDGKYIYQVNKGKVVIIRAHPSEKMEIVCMLECSDDGFSPQELFVDKKQLVVIGTASQYWWPRSGIANSRFMPAFYPRQMTKAAVYDIEDKSNPRKLRELELNGSYVSSRKIGENLYLLARKNIFFCFGQEIEEPKPAYRDSVLGGELVEIDYQDIRYFPGFIESSYLLVAGIRLDHPDEKASVSSFLGSSQNVYASLQNLYVAVSSPWRPQFRWPSAFLPWDAKISTRIYKFGMDEGRLSFLACGKVPGTVLNQFSMDEFDGYFRIATTEGNYWRADGGGPRNNVFIFDNGMNITGKLKGIAPGERIYSARFMGGRGYLVTFRTVDPFFVLDLKDPANPCILGELKIPGYSNYLHPYDENHIIGFGKDAVEVSGMAFYMGMKMALFDVSDVRNPVEKFSEKIGDRGTDSELLRNHKALLFSKDKSLLAFPVRIFEVKEDVSSPNAFPAYGSYSFQGAYVYSIDLLRGFVQKGKITHRSDTNNPEPCFWTGYEKDIERIIYVDDTLYTLSKGLIKANSIDDLKEIGSLEIK